MQYERVARPHRRVVDTVVVAARSGAVLHLEATAAAVWEAAASPVDSHAIAERLAQRWPAVDHAEIDSAVVRILGDLVDAGVIREC